MIKYECDMCGEIKSKTKINIIEYFPRRYINRIFYDLGEKPLDEKYYFTETHLCTDCCKKIALMLPEVSK